MDRWTPEQAVQAASAGLLPSLHALLGSGSAQAKVCSNVVMVL